MVKSTRFLALVLVYAAVLASLGPAYVLALAPAPTLTVATRIDNALFDRAAKSGSAKINRDQKLLGYSFDFHDDEHQYSLPACADAVFIQSTGGILKPEAFTVNDTLIVSIQPNPAADAKACIERIVRQQITRSTSGSECLRNFQVKHGVREEPAQLNVRTAYIFELTAYTRPTLDCDAATYGSTPITTVIAGNTPFVFILSRRGPDGKYSEVMRWTVVTDGAGKAGIPYTFVTPSEHYRFSVTSASNTAAGDIVSWDAKVTNPHPLPTPIPIEPTRPDTWMLPYAAGLGVITVLLIGFDLWRRIRRRRAQELPEAEYERVSRL